MLQHSKWSTHRCRHSTAEQSDVCARHSLSCHEVKGWVDGTVLSDGHLEGGTRGQGGRPGRNNQSNKNQTRAVSNMTARLLYPQTAPLLHNAVHCKSSLSTARSRHDSGLPTDSQGSSFQNSRIISSSSVLGEGNNSHAPIIGAS